MPKLRVDECALRVEGVQEGKVSQWPYICDIMALTLVDTRETRLHLRRGLNRGPFCQLILQATLTQVLLQQSHTMTVNIALLVFILECH